MFSKSCEYGMRAVIYIAKETALGFKPGVKEISKATNSPEAFMSKILQKLTRAGVTSSIKGPYGGFYIDSATTKAVPLSRIVEIIDGDAIYMGCGLGLRECNAEKPCPLHDKFVDIRNSLKNMLETTSIHDLIKSETGDYKILQLKR
jgi:Rrf2 family protein